MWRRRPTGAPWRMATPSSAARMVLTVLTGSLTANSLRHAVSVNSFCAVQSYCAATAHLTPKGYSAAPAGLLPCFCRVIVWSPGRLWARLLCCCSGRLPGTL